LIEVGAVTYTSLGYLSPITYENRYRDHVTSTPQVA